MKRWLHTLAVAGLACAQAAPAWQVELRDGGLWVGNAEALARADVYLAWYDADGAPGQQVYSWRQAEGWRAGLLPIFGQALDLPALAATPLPGVGLPQACPDQHRCFVGLLALRPGDNPLNRGLWQRASLVPLNVAAAAQRIPGQTVFTASSNQAMRDNAYALADGTTAPTAAPEAGDKSAATTEKPDLFRLQGSEVLYANGQAEKFQVIETADPAHPVLSAQTDLIGSPREVYALNGYYVLLQGESNNGNYNAAPKSYLTVLADNGSGLSQVAQSELPGWFMESRRRGEVIYTVTQDWSNTAQLHITAVQIGADGTPSRLAGADIPGYDAEVAIFQDYLVVANHDPNDWWRSQVQVYDLTQGGLNALPVLNVPGRIPSEFHLDVQAGQLRLVYGPVDRSQGSTLAVYNLPDLQPVGAVQNIAPGEDLFATRFVDNLAFVVTYERKDPLWVIDLSNPAQPVIKGELHVPGWSEKLFFHDNRLFAVGVDDQPAPGENLQWVRRAAMSLFDVSDPTQPALLDRFTPLAGQVSWSWSPALDDERALLLDWTDAYAALPLESWETQAGSHLQLARFGQDKFEDAGRLDLNTPVLRSLELAPGKLGVLGEQSFFTVQWGTGKPQVLGELELASNLTWLNAPSTGSGGGELFAAAQGRNGYYRLYRYPLSAGAPSTGSGSSAPTQRWTLPRGYEGVVTDGKLAVFYSRNPLAIQVIDLASGDLWPAEQLEAANPDGSVTTWYQRGAPLLQNGKLYVAEYQDAGTVYPADKMVALDSSMAAMPMQPAMWLLRNWQLTPQGAVAGSKYSIPGESLALTAENSLLTREYTDEGKLRLNLLALENTQARLLDSQTLECGSGGPLWDGKQLYVSCAPYTYYPYPVLYADTASDSSFAPTPQPAPRVLRFTADMQLKQTGAWEMPEYRQILAAANDRVLLGTSYYWGYYRVMDMAVMPSTGCELYDLAGGKPALLKKLDSCPWSSEAVALTPNQGYMARGFAGLESF